MRPECPNCGRYSGCDCRYLKPVTRCTKQHVVDLPDTKVRVTFPDGTYAELAMSVIEGAAMLAMIQERTGIKMGLRNEHGDSLA